MVQFFLGLEKGEEKRSGFWGGWRHGLLSIILIEVTRHRRMVLCLRTEDKDGGSREEDPGSRENIQRVLSTAERTSERIGPHRPDDGHLRGDLLCRRLEA